MKDATARTMGVRFNRDDVARLERWKRIIMSDTDSQAIRIALRWLERHEPRMVAALADEVADGQ